jgi:hypothetical protein
MSMLRRLISSEGVHFISYALISLLVHIRPLASGLPITRGYPLDPICKNYPLKLLYGRILHNGELPLWSPYEYAGFPLLGNIEVGVLYPPNLLFYWLFSSETAYNLLYVLHFALAAFFTFAYVRLLGTGRLPAFLAGLVFGFTGFMHIEALHLNIGNAAAYLPLIMYLYQKLRDQPGLRYSFFIAMAIAVQVFAGSFQMCVYTYIVTGLFVVYQAFFFERSEKRIRFLLLGFLGFALGVILALPQIIATLELSTQSFLRVRKLFTGYEFFSTFHFYLLELPSLIFPGLFAGWGIPDHMNAGIGPIVVVFAIVGAVAGLGRNRNAVFWAGVAVLGLLLAMGPDTPLNRLMYHIPVINQFRVTGRHLLEFTFAASVLCAFGLEWILNREDIRARATRYLLVIISAIMLLSFATVIMLPLLSPDTLIVFLEEQRFREPGRLSDALAVSNPHLYRPLAMLAAVAAWVILQRMFRRRTFRILITLLIVFETASLGGYPGILMKTPRTYVDNSQNMCVSEEYGSIIQNTLPEHSRLVNVFPPGQICSATYNPMAHLTCSVGAVNSYSPLNLERYSALLELGWTGRYSLRWNHVLQNNIVLSMLRGGYLIISKKMNLYLDGILFAAEGRPPEPDPLVWPEWTPGKGVRWDGNEAALSSLQGEMAELIAQVSLAPGTYEFCLDARGDHRDKALALYLYEMPSYTKREALFLYPDHLGPDFSTFCQVLSIRATRRFYVARIETLSKAPIHIRNIAVRHIEGYQPPKLGKNIAGEQVYELVAETEQAFIYRNRNVLPVAWSVTNIIPARDFHEVKKKIHALALNPRREALVYGDELSGMTKMRFEPVDISLDRFEPHEVALTLSSQGNGFVVLSEQYYPGWRAFIDGKETHIYAVNGILRGVLTPPGNHELVFKYRPSKIYRAMLVSAVFTGIMAFSLLFLRRRKG